MEDEATLKITAKPIHATEREADLFQLANHYRAMVERLLEQTQRHRVLYSDSLAREIALELMTTPRADLLYFQPRSALTAPADGSSQVFLVDEWRAPVVGHWHLRMKAWVDDARGTPFRPRAFVPIGGGA